MKEENEISEKQFHAIATIDAGYFMLTQEQEALKKANSKKDMIRIAKNIKIILKDIVKYKKVLDIETSNDEQALVQCDLMLKNLI